MKRDDGFSFSSAAVVVPFRRSPPEDKLAESCPKLIVEDAVDDDVAARV
jgi:hypothetical protein